MANATTSLPARKSTIVRANLGVRLRGIALALAEREAPRLGARLAVRMWLTIPPAAIRPAMTEPGERTVLRGRVVAESWGAGPAVYLLHGWGGYRGQLGAFVEPLTSAGFRVVAVDALGHGESGPGRYGRGRALMPDFIAALEAAIAHYGPAHGVIAHSLGASATAIAVLDGLPVNRLVLIAPVSNAMSGIDIFARTAGVGPRVRAKMPRRIQRLARIPVEHFDVVTRSAERDELPPVLVIHDTGDRRVPFDLGVLVATAWPGARLEPTEGLGHLRILQHPEVTKSAAGFLTGVPAAGRRQV
jgi:pimeloyl-ACP methyl ester carboxylesterase